MRILLVHNKYKLAGGEDGVFRAEGELLSRHGHEVQQLLFDNSRIHRWRDQVLSGIMALYNPLSARAVQAWIDGFHPEIIHVHNYTPLISPAVFFVANRNRIPIVHTLHNFRLICPSATLFHNGSIYEKSVHALFPWDAIRKGVYRNSRLQTAVVAAVTSFHNAVGTWHTRVDQYITPTEFAKRMFVNSELSLPEEKITVKPSFVEHADKVRSAREDFFLYVGRLTEEKGVRTLLNAAARSSFNLVIAGDGPLRRLVEESSVANRHITYAGFQNREGVFRYLRQCRALIFPSVCYEGGTPLTILEAFSSGTLVLASRLGAMEEIIEDQVNGVHFEAGNADDLASKVNEITKYPERSLRIAENGYRSYLERYTPEKNYEQLLEIYRRALAIRAGREIVIPAAEIA